MAAARRAADYLVKNWSVLPADWGVGADVAPHVALTGLERTMLALHRATGDPAYLQFCIRTRALPQWDLGIVIGRRPGIEGHVYAVGVTAHEGSAEGEDPVPPGFNWDLWVGPSALRPFKRDVYHPFRWRDWFDFGNGGLADIWCHAINRPMRALDLGYPERIVINLQDGKQTEGKAAVEFHFPARGSLQPVALHWQGSGTPPAEVLQPLVDVYKDKTPGGLMIIGAKGCLYTSHWNTGGLIRLHGEPRLKDVLHHEATQDIPETLPRIGNHGQEWLDACRGQGRTYSDFDVGGKLTEIGLAGVVGLRAGQSLDWDGEKMEAKNVPAAARFVHTEYRTKWLS